MSGAASAAELHHRLHVPADQARHHLRCGEGTSFTYTGGRENAAEICVWLPTPECPTLIVFGFAFLSGELSQRAPWRVRPQRGPPTRTERAPRRQALGSRGRWPE